MARVAATYSPSNRGRNGGNIGSSGGSSGGSGEGGASGAPPSGVSVSVRLRPLFAAERAAGASEVFVKDSEGKLVEQRVRALGVELRT